MLEEKPSKRVIVFSTLDRPFAVLLNLDFVVDRELSLATRSCRASELARRMPRRGRPMAELVAQRKAAALDQAEAECREHGFHLSQPTGKARKGVKTVAGIARDFEVSKTTIQHRLRGGRSRADEGKERQALDPEEEERIIDYTAQAAQAQFPLAKRHVLQFANKIRRERGHTDRISARAGTGTSRSGTEGGYSCGEPNALPRSETMRCRSVRCRGGGRMYAPLSG